MLCTVGFFGASMVRQFNIACDYSFTLRPGVTQPMVVKGDEVVVDVHPSGDV